MNIDEEKREKWRKWFIAKMHDTKFSVGVRITFFIFSLFIIYLVSQISPSRASHTPGRHYSSETQQNLQTGTEKFAGAENGFGETEFRQAVKNGKIQQVTAQKNEILDSYILQGELDKTTIFKLLVSVNWYNRELEPFLKNYSVSIIPLNTETQWGTNPWIYLVIFAAIIAALSLIRFWPAQSKSWKHIRSKFGYSAEETGGHTEAGVEIIQPGEMSTTFSDVAGCDEAKKELKEIIDFLKNPDKYKKLGARIPYGVLLAGPPGTGKTLLAKATAGEANVPFLSIAGSGFVELFVGVGASRVRDLFKKAREIAPCIIFIDEIDSPGGARETSSYAHSDEREQTLTGLLIEMDGFSKERPKIIVMAATNRPDKLDPALVRPGRFDRKIVLDLPDLTGREAILKIHAREVKIGRSNEEKEKLIKTIAKRTIGLSGADLANIINEAALLASSENKECVELHELAKATEREVVGQERKSKKMTEKEQKISARHEAGHAIVGFYLKKDFEIHKISIVRTGMGLGYTIGLPTEDKSLIQKKELENTIAYLLGGRAAEEIWFGKENISTGAANDIERATKLARDYVCCFGMDEKIGPLSYGSSRQNYLGHNWELNNDCSEATAKLIDERVEKLVKKCYGRAEETLEAHEDKVNIVVKRLLEKESLEKEEIEATLRGYCQEELPF